MKGFDEFKGYRTRTVYDPKSKEFVTRRVEYTELNFGDAKVTTKTQVKSTSPPAPDLGGQHTNPDAASVGPVLPRKRSKSKTKTNFVSGSSAAVRRQII